MNGCYGDHPEDKYFEHQLDEQLNRQERAANELEEAIEARKAETYAKYDSFEELLIHGYEAISKIAPELWMMMRRAGDLRKGSQAAAYEILATVAIIKEKLDNEIAYIVRREFEHRKD